MTDGELVSGNYFRSLGIGAIRGARHRRRGRPRAGQTFGGGDQLRYCWRRRFGGDPNVVGRTLSISNQPMTIIGVLEPGFDGMNLADSSQFFVPVTMEGVLIPPSPRFRSAGCAG